MKKVISLAVAVLMVFSSVSLSSCAGKKAGANVSGNAATEGADGPLAKYKKTVTLTAVAGVDSPEDTSTPKGVTPETNSFIKLCKDKLNIQIKYLWTTTSDQYSQKLKLSLSSGQMPDILKTDSSTFQQLYNSNSLTDLTQLEKKYCLPGIQQDYAQNDNVSLKYASRGGKLYALPYQMDTKQDIRILWIRQDWMDNLGLQAPKTMQDVIRIARTFVKNDPDKDGKNDTYGLAMSKDNFASWFGDIMGFAYGYHAYPNSWVKGSDGSLVYGSIQPAVKNTLQSLQNMYKDGLIDREFATKDETKIEEDVAAGKTGLMFGSWWTCNLSQLYSTAGKDGGPVWKAYPIVSADAAPVKQLMNRADIGAYNVVLKQCKTPEAMIKVVNLDWDIMDSAGARQRYGDAVLPKNGYVYNWDPVYVYLSLTQHNNYVDVGKALEKKDPSYLKTDDATKLYRASVNYLSNKKAGPDWGLYYSRADKDGGWGVTEQIAASKPYVYDEYYGPTTQTQTQKGSTLQAEQDQAFTNMIMGAPISGFDKFVSDWKNLGGNQITKEVNDWYKQQNK